MDSEELQSITRRASLKTSQYDHIIMDPKALRTLIPSVTDRFIGPLLFLIMFCTNLVRIIQAKVEIEDIFLVHWILAFVAHSINKERGSVDHQP